LEKKKKMFRNLIIPRRHSSTAQFVDRYRRQQLIKESNEECSKLIDQGQFFLYHRGKPLLEKSEFKIQNNRPQTVSYAQVSKFVQNIDKEAVFLRFNDSEKEIPIFAAMLPKDANIEEIENSVDGKFVDMRAALFLVRSEWSGLMSGGSSLLRWIKAAKFCWSCKAPLTRNTSGCQLKCSNTECGNVFHPQTSPVGISLIASEDHSRALLIRQAAYPPGMYSCVAGFVDAGESLVECVIRETAEEAGVEINPDSFQLVDSNHWPNPAGSLMLGSIVTTKTKDPTPCSHEIEAVRWFTPRELRDAVRLVEEKPNLRFAKNHDPKNLFVPPRGAIANVIIQTWLKKYHQM